MKIFLIVIAVVAIVVVSYLITVLLAMVSHKLDYPSLTWETCHDDVTEDGLSFFMMLMPVVNVAISLIILLWTASNYLLGRIIKKLDK